MHHYALLGRHLSHSFSKIYFEEKFRRLNLEGGSYKLVETEDLSSIHSLVSELTLDGFNITIPYKVDIIPLLDAVDPTALETGAVNTVLVSQGKSLTGFNTDAQAFMETLTPHLKPWHDKALILGTGGAARAVAWALRRLNISYRFVSRNPERDFSEGIDKSLVTSYEGAYKTASDHLLIINATPLGMFPNCHATPWQHDELFTPRHLCFDLVYNPSPTLFLQQANKRGATTIDGLAMLHRQADLAFDIWNK